MDDLISRKAAIDVADYTDYTGLTIEDVKKVTDEVVKGLKRLPSALPETPSYVAEIESEYKKWVSMPHINKPLAKALYEVWKKHDREDVSRNG